MNLRSIEGQFIKAKPQGILPVTNSVGFSLFLVEILSHRRYFNKIRSYSLWLIILIQADRGNVWLCRVDKWQ